MGVPEIRVEELKQRLDAGENLFLLDVRDEYEYEISNVGGQLIPLLELSRRLNELDLNRNIVTVCKMGPRGVKATQVLRRAGFSHVWNLAGGIHAWSDPVGHSVRKYKVFFKGIGGEAVNAQVCKTCIRGFDSRPVLQIFCSVTGLSA